MKKESSLTLIVVIIAATIIISQIISMYFQTKIRELDVQKNLVYYARQQQLTNQLIQSIYELESTLQNFANEKQ